MSISRHHAEWLSLIEQSGPFLSMPVLMRAFPHGLDPRDAGAARRLSGAYEAWQEANAGPAAAAAHRQWFSHVLTEFLAWPADFILEGQTLPPGMEAPQPTHGEVLRPDFALRDRDAGKPPVLLVHLHHRDVPLEKPLAGHLWKASPATRMAELLRATRIPVGLVTNGEQWMLVHARDGEASGFASWFADLWFQEGLTLRAFQSLLCLPRFFSVSAVDTLAALLEESRKNQQEVTDQLGLQVRQAVEVLVQAFDRLDAETGRSLLTGVAERALYESALTIMMRLVFLFAAEERGLLLLGDPFFDEHYAVSTLCDQLRGYADLHGEEILERRSDAWCRLLATFRAVHGGVQHEAMRLPAYGGSLFDPDRFPFLEGRAAGTRWKETPSQPVAVNNRVVLHLLEALQVLRVKVPGGGPAEARRVSFRALDIEQIGHVYEGLLDHTARRASEVLLGLQGAQGSNPEIPLSKLEALAGEGTAALVKFLKEETSRSESALKNAVEAGLARPEARAGIERSGRRAKGAEVLFPVEALLPACGQDRALAGRIAPFANLLRADSFGHPVVVLPESVYVGPGSDRRSTGTHYTPRTLTEPIVQHTLDPLVYRGPAEGWLQEKWELKSPAEILALKVCDMAMGSGAFLVAACRYLAEKLVESWERLERSHPGEFITTPEGELSRGNPSERLLPADPAERLHFAARAVADRCLYGVDINPMAVEMAKLSLWLITVDRERPFTFLDHALKCGDSLLGVSKLKQIENFTLRAADGVYVDIPFAAMNLFRYTEEASTKRRALESLPSNDSSQIEEKKRLFAHAEAAIAKVKSIADLLISLELQCLGNDAYENQRIGVAEKVQHCIQQDADAGIEVSDPNSRLARAAREGLKGRRTFHWPVEFPEVFEKGGFDAFVGNPPFKAGASLSTLYGEDWRKLIVADLGENTRTVRGQFDLSVFFFLQGCRLIAPFGVVAGISTNSFAQGDSKIIGISRLYQSGFVVIRAVVDLLWPGDAATHACLIWLSQSTWAGMVWLDGTPVRYINDSLAEGEVAAQPSFKLLVNMGIGFRGAMPYGEGFFIDSREAELLLAQSDANATVLLPYLGGHDVTTHPSQQPSRYIINFRDWPLHREEGSGQRPCAEDFPELLKIVENRVKPQRLALRENNSTARHRRDVWWQFSNRADDLYSALNGKNRAIAISRTTAHLSFAFVPTDIVLSERLVVLADDSDEMFGLVQSSIHEAWAFRPGTTTQRTTPTYFTGEAFETFPRPEDYVSVAPVASRYNHFRASLMKEVGIGLTSIYNRFHNPRDVSASISELRILHRQLDVAVATAYGWADLAANGGAALGHDFHDSKNCPRYTLTPIARREILARLHDLNHQQHAEEVAADMYGKKSKPTKVPSARGKKKQASAGMVVGPLPDGWRFPHDTPARYAINLVSALLSSRLEGLSWPDLRDAFAAATVPSLMVQLALPDDSQMTQKWAKRWNEDATPDFLIPALQEIGSSNIEVNGSGLFAVFSLKDGPKPPATEDVGYDAWLALRVTGALKSPRIECPEQDSLDLALEQFLLTV